MKVSIIIPTYYRSKDLSLLFNSLLEKTVKPIEIIVVDDTPTAVIRYVCKMYKDKFDKPGTQLLYIRNNGERSISIARNLGAKIAKGDILLFLDSDVILYSEYIEKILEVFNKHPDAIGVQGWTVFPPSSRKGIRHHLIQTLLELFYLPGHLTNDSCEYPSYPINLEKTITCNWLNGLGMAVKHSVLNEIQFDEKLGGYSYMEDVLFSHSIYKKYPKKLFITPYAKCIHKVSREGRMHCSVLSNHKNRCRKYVLMNLFGLKGLLIYGWQNLGLLIFRVIEKI
jgi:GT2 family glycosyltransferase